MALDSESDMDRHLRLTAVATALIALSVLFVALMLVLATEAN